MQQVQYVPQKRIVTICGLPNSGKTALFKTLAGKSKLWSADNTMLAEIHLENGDVVYLTERDSKVYFPVNTDTFIICFSNHQNDEADVAELKSYIRTNFPNADIRFSGLRVEPYNKSEEYQMSVRKQFGLV